MIQRNKQWDHAAVQSKKLITVGFEKTERLNLNKMAHEKKTICWLFSCDSWAMGNTPPPQNHICIVNMLRLCHLSLAATL